MRSVITTSMTSHAVVITGAGPTGLMLAAELALARVDVAIVERRPDQELAGSRAGGLHARTIEMLDLRGIAERFLSEGTVMQVAGFAMIPLDIRDLPSRRNHGLALFQNHIERILAGWVAELGVPIVRGVELETFAQDGSGVDLALSDGRTLRAQYLVGCDGGRSRVRKQAGIDFAGWDPSTSYVIAEASTAEEPAWGMRVTATTTHGIAKLDDGRARFVLEDAQVRDGDPTLEEFRAILVAVYGTDFGVRDVTWLSRFTDATRQAVSYRDRRVLLAGDAAHVHSPAGGQGLNLGVQDAMNLGWKLAQVVHGTSPESLLDTYHAERHPVAARVLQLTMAQTALRRGDDRTKAMHAVTADLLRNDEARRRYGAIMSGLELHYDLGAGHPLLGRRMPDLELATAEGPRFVSSFLHAARPVLIDFGRTVGTDRVSVIRATYDGGWELPVLGAVPPPSAVLVRPDGYVAWAGSGTDDGLAAALDRWFGPGPSTALRSTSA